MVNLFGDWTGDMIVILFAFAIFLIIRFFAVTDKKSVDRFILGFSLVVFVITGAELIGNILGELYIGPEGSLLISLILFAGSIVYILNQIVELKAQKK
jgi:hypothetical protein